MKKYLLLLISIAVLAGCKLDEAGFPKPEDAGTVIGTWFIKSQTTSGTVLGVIIPATITTGFTSLDFYKFNTDLSAIYSQSSPATVTNSTYVYTATAHTLVVKTTGAPDNSFTIKKLTKDSLVLSTTVSVPSLSTETNVVLRLAHQ